MGLCCSCFDVLVGRSVQYEPLKHEITKPSKTTISLLGKKYKNDEIKDPTLTGTIAILLAAKFCRNSSLYRWREETMPNVGRRGYKYNFLIDCLDLNGNPHSVLVMSVFPKSISGLPNINDSYVLKIKYLLVAFKHPYILPCVDVGYSKDRQALIVLRPFSHIGSLKDLIYGRVDPRLPYSQKYQEGKSKGMDLALISKYGRHVLEALAVLRRKGMICQHLCTSNVIVHNGVARLSDLENTVLAVGRYREWIDLTISLESVYCMDLDIILFGHLIYEMAVGMELRSPKPLPCTLGTLDVAVQEVLDLIFFPNENNKVVKFNDLLDHSFFQSVELEISPTVALDSQMKNILKDASKTYTKTNEAHIQEYNEMIARELQQQKLKEKVNEVIFEKSHRRRDSKISLSNLHPTSTIRSVYRSRNSVIERG